MKYAYMVTVSITDKASGRVMGAKQALLISAQSTLALALGDAAQVLPQFVTASVNAAVSGINALQQPVTVAQ